MKTLAAKNGGIDDAFHGIIGCDGRCSDASGMTRGWRQRKMLTWHQATWHRAFGMAWRGGAGNLQPQLSILPSRVATAPGQRRHPSLSSSSLPHGGWHGGTSVTTQLMALGGGGSVSESCLVSRSRFDDVLVAAGSYEIIDGIESWQRRPWQREAAGGSWLSETLAWPLRLHHRAEGSKRISPHLMTPRAYCCDKAKASSYISLQPGGTLMTLISAAKVSIYQYENQQCDAARCCASCALSAAAADASS